MTNWSLTKLFDAIQKDTVQKLETARNALDHPGDKGDASEQVWIDLLGEYLPRCFTAARPHSALSFG